MEFIGFRLPMVFVDSIEATHTIYGIHGFGDQEIHASLLGVTDVECREAMKWCGIQLKPLVTESGAYSGVS